MKVESQVHHAVNVYDCFKSVEIYIAADVSRCPRVKNKNALIEYQELRVQNVCGQQQLIRDN